MQKFASRFFFSFALPPLFFGCASNQVQNEQSASQTQDALIPVIRKPIPQSAYKEVASFGEEGTFNDSEIVTWKEGMSFSDNKIYIKNPQKFGEQSVSLVDAGNGKKILRTEFNLGTSDTQYSLLFNTAGQYPYCDLSNRIFKIRLYISDYLTLLNEPFVPYLSFIAYYGKNEWKQVNFSGDLSYFTFSDIGQGWQEILLDFSTNTYSLGNKTGNFSVSKEAVNQNTMLGIEIKAKKVNGTINIPILVEKVEISSANKKLP